MGCDIDIPGEYYKTKYILCIFYFNLLSKLHILDFIV